MKKADVTILMDTWDVVNLPEIACPFNNVTV